TELFSPVRRRTSVRSRLAGDDQVVLLSVSRLSPEKRLDNLLAAFELARSVDPTLRLIVVGDGPARADLQEGAGQGIAFLGEVRGVELADVYANADIFCFPSTTDTFGQVLLEAGASALPVVAVGAGGTVELVRDRVTGIVVPPDD